jgi:hypothetical protein
MNYKLYRLLFTLPRLYYDLPKLYVTLPLPQLFLTLPQPCVRPQVNRNYKLCCPGPTLL